MFWLHLPEDDTAHKRPVCVCVCTLLDAPWQSINDMNLYKQAMFFAYSKWVRTKDDPVSCVSMEGPSVYMLLPSLLLPLFTCPFHLRPKLRRRMLRCDSLWLSLRPVYGAPPAALSIQLVHLSLSHWGPAALATHTNEPDWRTFVKRKGVIWEIKKKKKGKLRLTRIMLFWLLRPGGLVHDPPELHEACPNLGFMAVPWHAAGGGRTGMVAVVSSCISATAALLVLDEIHDASQGESLSTPATR